MRRENYVPPGLLLLFGSKLLSCVLLLDGLASAFCDKNVNDVEEDSRR